MLALLGHFAVHLAIYNRLNATGLRRATIKRIEKVFVLTCVALPIWLLYTLLHRTGSLEETLQRFNELPTAVQWYGVFCLIALIFLGVPWLLWRPLLGWEWAATTRRVRTLKVNRIVEQPLALSRKCKLASRIPFNQIFDLAIEEIDLPVIGLPSSLDGVRIAQLSDLHFTGDMSPRYARYVIEQSNDWGPDLLVLTGDIIDKQPCIAWVADLFRESKATYGQYFVLGNHDTRVADPREIRNAMRASGWTDLGGKCKRVSVRTELVEIIGNELPWFPAAAIQSCAPGELATPFRVLVSHSPDQIWWARRHGVGLMLAGHTHGGQGRIPLAGPLLSPSWHGSRFASGDFYKSPTTMHVSRGLGGVHLLRWNCRPELSLITLRASNVKVR